MNSTCEGVKSKSGRPSNYFETGNFAGQRKILKIMLGQYLTFSSLHSFMFTCSWQCVVNAIQPKNKLPSMYSDEINPCLPQSFFIPYFHKASNSVYWRLSAFCNQLPSIDLRVSLFSLPWICLEYVELKQNQNKPFVELLVDPLSPLSLQQHWQNPVALTPLVS